MKKNSVLVLACMLLVGSFSMNLSAQEHLAAVVKKCEAIDSADVNVIYQRNPTTKKLQQMIKTVSLDKNPAIVNEVLAAFEKDKAMAVQAIDGKTKGKMMPQFYKFSDGKINISYSVSVSDSGDVSLTVIEQY